MGHGLAIIRELIHQMGDDPNREGLKETPERVIRSFDELFCGYHMNPRSVFKIFKEDGVKSGMAIFKHIAFYSTCEHHLLPFYGEVHIGYIPREGNVMGLSKPARLVEIFSRRLQLQERMTEQIADSITQILNPIGCGVISIGHHLCSMARGVKQHALEMEWEALRGSFLEDQKVREEFLFRVSR